MSQTISKLRVVPAQVNFLTLYNPSLGNSDETERDQILFYISRDELTRNSRKGRQHERVRDGDRPARSEDEKQNERLRQVGLAQGIVNFAKTFSNGVNVDSIDTEKSRVILHELEPGWWILTSIDLTQLPAAKRANDTASGPAVEYSSREVSPPQLLVTQLVQAHATFLLHHAAGLDDLYGRVGRPNLCGLLEKFWTRFVNTWDVLLHGNPAIDIYNCTKLASGGELGFGVGEEEWGSSEREVLEGFIDRTEGLLDLVVGRYGSSPINRRRHGEASSKALEQDIPWLGAGEDSGPADGVIFSGMGTLSKKSLVTVSQWMETIFKHGDTAYGVGENPSSRPRQRRIRPKIQRKESDNPPTSGKSTTDGGTDVSSPRFRSPKTRAPDLRKKAIENNATPPGIPAPLVSQVERSLDQALAKAEQRSSSRSPKVEKSEAESMSWGPERSTFGAENMKKILTLGYGSAWTLNPKGLPSNKPEDKPKKEIPSAKASTPSNNPSAHDTAVSQDLQEIDPTPEVSEGEDEDSNFKQRFDQSIGKFLIGLSGDLENPNSDVDQLGEAGDGAYRPHATQRIYMRTITVKFEHPNYRQKARTRRSKSSKSLQSDKSTTASRDEPKTSAAASVDGPQPNISHQKVQVAVYIHQPFIFVFLFELHTPSLTLPAFYRSIHHQLGPLQQLLMRSTDPARVAERIAEVTQEKSSTSTERNQEANTIYDIIYDPMRLTVRTSIPNIPVPGSLAAEGLTVQSSSVTVSGSWYTLSIPIGSSGSASPGSDPDRLVQYGWNRIEALNVHAQILNTWIASRHSNDLERTVKTSRQWWVLWMKVPLEGECETYKEAVLVRKSADYSGANQGTKSSGRGPGRWLLREQPRDISGSSNGNGRTISARGVSDGVGVDARKWVVALMHLTQ